MQKATKSLPLKAVPYASPQDYLGRPLSDTISSVKLDREGWLEARRDGLGGSDIAAILGLSPWRTPEQVAASKKRAGASPDFTSAVMRRGNILEPLVISELTTMLQLRTCRNNQLYFNTKYPQALATPDAFAIFEGQLAIVEAKTTAKLTKLAMDCYLAQLQWYLGVLELQVGLLVIKEGRERSNVWKIDYSVDFFTDAINKAHDFCRANEIGGALG